MKDWKLVKIWTIWESLPEGPSALCCHPRKTIQINFPEDLT
jgi:hypothetical protein